MIRLENVLKISLQDVLTMSWRRLWNVLKTSRTCLEDVFQDVLKTLRIRLEDLLKTSLKSLEEVLKMSWRRLEDVFKTPSRHLEDVWPRRIYWSWPRRLKDVLKTSPEDVRLRRTYSSTYSSWSRSLEDVFKTSSRHLHQDVCMLGRNLLIIMVAHLLKEVIVRKF